MKERREWGWGGHRQINKSNSKSYKTPRAITLLINGRATSVNIKEMSIKMTYNYPQFLPKLAEWHVYGNEQQDVLNTSKYDVRYVHKMLRGVI